MLHQFLLSIPFLLFSLPTFSQDTIQIEAVDVNYCIHAPRGDIKVIRNRKELEEKVRNDASRERCLKELESFDMSGVWLAGTTFITGWCHYPGGLKYYAVVDHNLKEYVIHVSYDKAEIPCRALGMHRLWLQLPDPDDDYSVRIDITEISE